MLEQLARYHPALPDIAAALLLLLVAWLAYFVATRFLLVVVRSLAKRSTQTWDDALIHNRVGEKLAQLVPAFVIYSGVGLLPHINETVSAVVTNVTSAYMLVVAAITIIATLNAANDIYESNPRARQRPIKGFIE